MASNHEFKLIINYIFNSKFKLWVNYFILGDEEWDVALICHHRNKIDYYIKLSEKPKDANVKLKCALHFVYKDQSGHFVTSVTSLLGYHCIYHCIISTGFTLTFNFITWNYIDLNHKV